MPTVPDDSFECPDAYGPGSVWADRVSERSLVGCNQRGVEIPIGMGEGEISPGELLKIALIGCAGMSADIPLGRRLGEDFAMRLWAHGTADEEQDRYLRIDEEVQLDLSGLSAEEITRVVTVFERAVAAACTVERTIVPGVEVTHKISGNPQVEGNAAGQEQR
ncbi:OsmC family protein [Brachybacterium sp. p3-SID1565]|uniref:OsmC family protein n=1 Tax=Brachybacterium epidermidis TaxID=2781983 RepID=A0ABR9W124_9MICO|nr:MULTISPECIES: OsmC family protein [Brachybacterium]MBE9404147.1 OsmC family protein [Brachybacterium epidermidis]MCT1385289.1 OsmC family protein [Brachybacterium sp. p3-SID1565]